MTIDGLVRALTIVCAVGAGLIGGVFFAFSTFVMKGLDDLPATQGIATMQSINKAAPKNALFVTALTGIALMCGVLILLSFLKLGEPGAWLRIVGGALYMPAIILTAAYHVPKNDELAVLDPGGPASAAYWASYVTDWTAWNHLRTLGPLAAAALLILSLSRA